LKDSERTERIIELERQIERARSELQQLHSNVSMAQSSEGFSPKYTQGPWDLFQVDDQCMSISGAGGRNAMANAYLITASPDLYEALVSANSQLKALSAKFLNTAFNDEKIEAAIAKAEGFKGENRNKYSIRYVFMSQD
jgi:hypothetical protein